MPSASGNRRKRIWRRQAKLPTEGVRALILVVCAHIAGLARLLAFARQ